MLFYKLFAFCSLQILIDHLSLQLEQNILYYVKSLVKDIDVNFWANGRFLVHTDRQMAFHKEGKNCSFHYHLITILHCVLFSY